MTAKRNSPRLRLFAVIGGIAAMAALALLAVLLMRGGNSKGVLDPQTGDFSIPISGLSQDAAFYPLKVSGVNMEVIALYAADGSLRAAFNTCQVCYGSGRGYYKTDGDELVCQNCFNRFTMDEVGVVSGGCNPVPIVEQYRREENGSLVIDNGLLKAAGEIFKGWKS